MFITWFRVNGNSKMQIKELPPEESYSEEEQEPQPKPKRPPGRPRKPDDQLKRPRPKPVEKVVEAAEKKEEPAPKPETKPETFEESPWAMQRQFLKQFGDAQRRHNTQRREKYQALFRNHYS